jgi:general secretion pathway protein G
MTVAIIGLLATVTLPLAELSVQHSKEQELRLSLRQIREGIDAYKQAYDDGVIEHSLDRSGFPESLKQLVEGANDIKTPALNRKIYFLRRIPRDPFAQDASKSNEDTWGKRSYQSSADEPQEGRDVFDVYSLEPGMGLNGIPYRQW